jgi:uncharacterized membrane protein
VTSYSAEKLATTRKLKDMLTEEQSKKYKRITDSRKRTYFTGLAIGVVLSLLIIFLNNQSGNKLSKLHASCLTASVTLATAYFYYMLYPRTEYIITDLNTKEQREEWLKTYKKMQLNYHIGLCLGIMAVFVFSYAVCK